MPQLHTYVEHRLAAWAIWVYWGSSGRPQRVVSWYDKVVMAPNVQGRGDDSRPCPVNEAEAYETELAVRVLPEHLRDTVVECWLKSGTADYKARALRISRKQYYERLNVAEGKLLGYFNDQAAGIPLPEPEISHGHAKVRPIKNVLTLRDSFRTLAAKLA